MSVTLTKLKNIKVGDNTVLLFEMWDPYQYMATGFIEVDKDGQIIGDGQVQELCFPLRLQRSDDPADDMMVTANEEGQLTTFKFVPK